MIKDRWFPSILNQEGDLDAQEVFQSTQLVWESIYALQSDIEGTIKTVGEMVQAEKTAVAKSPQGFTVGDTGSDGGLTILNATRNRLPYIGSSLILDARKAPEYNPATEALTIVGAITGRSTLAISGATTLSSTLAVTGAVTLSSTLGVTGTSTLDGIIIIDVTNAEALLVRANSDGGDVFAVNTTTPGVIVTGTLNVTGTSLLSGTTTTFGRINTVTRKTTTYTILVTDSAIFGNTDSSAWTVTLPAGVSGQTFKIINSGSSGNNLTIDPNGSEHLLGVNENFILFDGETLDLTYDSTDGWY